MTFAMRMGVVPEQARRMIARNFNRVMQSLPRFRKHSQHVILGSVRRNLQPMKMQVRHVHAGIYRAGLRRLRRQVVDIRDSESVTGRSADDGSHRFSMESKGIPSVLIHSTKRERYNMI